jgi:hypothetical protein
VTKLTDRRIRLFWVEARQRMTFRRAAALLGLDEETAIGNSHSFSAFVDRLKT